MRLTVLVGLVISSLTVATSANAQLEAEVTGEAAEVAENIDALPGGYRIVSAGDMAPGLALNMTAGYGYTEDVLERADVHHRLRASAAATYRPMPWLAGGLRLDGRYDRHSGDMDPSDDGWIGEIRLIALGSKRLSEQLGVGLQLTGWIPGFDGISVDARAVGSGYFGFGRVHANLGFRLDRSAKTVENPDSLSQFDRLALGVSDSNAALLGVGGEIPLGSIDVLVEGTWDVLVGADAPSIIEGPIRLGAGARFPISNDLRVAAMLEASVGRAPFVAPMQPLVPVEPLIAINIVVSQRPSSRQTLAAVLDPEKEIVEKPVEPEGPRNPRMPREGLSGLRGIVRDAGGEPITGALVELATREVLTDENGTFSAQDLMPGELLVKVGATGFKNTAEIVRLEADKVRDINVILEPLETGTVVGAVQTFDGKPAAAKIKIEPGNHETSSGSDGRFEIKLPAGIYTFTAELDGHVARPMKVDLKVPGPVVIVNLDLRKQ